MLDKSNKAKNKLDGGLSSKSESPPIAFSEIRNGKLYATQNGEFLEIDKRQAAVFIENLKQLLNS
jgi:hypothetical protein